MERVKVGRNSGLKNHYKDMNKMVKRGKKVVRKISNCNRKCQQQRDKKKVKKNCEKFEIVNIYIYIYSCSYIQLLCLFRALMVDIFIIFRVQHFFRVQIRTNSGQ